MNVTICGSRDIYSADVGFILDILNSMFHFKEARQEDLHVITGGARGVDRWAKEWLDNNGIDNEVIPAEWERYGKRAGYIRNKEMVDKSDMVIAIWDGKSRGTKHTIDICKEQDKSLIVVVVVGTIFWYIKYADIKDDVRKWLEETSLHICL